MDAPDDRRSSNMDRIPSTSRSQRLSMEQSDNEDDYDLEAMGISDGFRPSNASPGHNRMSMRTANEQPPIRRSTPPPRPSSATKPRNIDSFALRHDGALSPTVYGPLVNPVTSSSVAGTVNRSSSISTDAPFMRPESPYRGPSAPSHPYQMYPQNARLARTLSVGTTSTYQPPSERQYSGPNGPTHPYGMYLQNTAAEPEDAEDEIPTIPVGFPGHHNQYHRRLGPDGEEAADIIGPDGHTEQLPPYTKYPDEAFVRKARSSVSNLSGAGGIGLATRDPQFASAEELSTPNTTVSTPSLTSNTNIPAVDVGTVPMSEKPAEEKWKTIVKRKVWGIVPIWVFVLVGIIILLFAILLAATLGVMRNRMAHSGPHQPPPSTTTSSIESSGTVTVTTTWDATRLSYSPTALPSLPVGTYGLDIGTPSASSPFCVNDSTQLNAWSCSIPPNMLRLIVANVIGASSLSNNMITIAEGNDTDSFPEYYYGTQPPLLLPNQTLVLVNDSESSLYGPAWFYQTLYDKLVIVNENSLSISSSSSASSKRRNSVPNFGFRRRDQAQAGDKPWFCHWNSTLLEVFIYPNATTGSGNGPFNPGATAYAPTGAAAATGQASSSTMTSSAPKSSGADYMSQFYPFYPNVVRLDERRLPPQSSTEPPYCVQMQILDDGQAVPVVNSTGDQQVIQLNENDPSASSLASSRRSLANLADRDTDSGEHECECMWLTS